MVRIVKKHFERKAEIIKIARQLFLTKRYDQATIQDVMDSLGISKGTVYHYFKSKEDLFEAVTEDIVDERIAMMDSLAKEMKGNALEKIQALITAGYMAGDQSDLLEYLHRPGNEGLHTRLLAKALLKQAPLYAQLIEQGCHEGIFQTETPLESAEFMLSALSFMTDIGIYPWSKEDLDRRRKAFSSIIEQLLKAPPKSFHFLIKSFAH